MKLQAFFAVLAVACAETPKPTLPEFPQAQADSACRNRPGHPRLVRLSSSPVLLEPGNSIRLEWEVRAVCAPIILTGLEVRIRGTDGTRADDRHDLPLVAATPDSPAQLDLMFGAREGQPPATIEIDVTPVWTEEVSGKFFSWAERVEPTAVTVTVRRVAPQTF